MALLKLKLFQIKRRHPSTGRRGNKRREGRKRSPFEDPPRVYSIHIQAANAASQAADGAGQSFVRTSFGRGEATRDHFPLGGEVQPAV